MHPLSTLGALSAVACAGTSALVPAEPATKKPGIVEVALTFDDLPRPGGSADDGLEVIRRIVHALEQHRVPPSYGFINAGVLEQHPEDRAALEAWRTAGNLLGNHTYSHARLPAVGLSTYLASIDQNEAVLRALGGSEREWKVFRYPFLQEGVDGPSRAAIRDHLSARGYRIAEVTLDFGDWAYGAPYARCLARGDVRGIDALRKTYHQLAWAEYNWFEAAARSLYGRPIRHVALLHVNAFTARELDALLTSWERLGARFVSLDRALEDPIYATDPGVGTTDGDTLIEQEIEARKAAHPPWVPQPLALLEVVCREGKAP